ncbi:MAG: alanine:cation symporter family protein [Alphaproteobacteria bacterium]|nr:alanine:cation symporter family protein [Alphaproteobacteria bacterium]
MLRLRRLVAVLWASVTTVLLTAGVAFAQDDRGLVADSTLQAIDKAFGAWVVGPLATVMFFDLVFWDDPEKGVALPAVVAWLVCGAVFFTIRMQFINLRGFVHAIRVTTGQYDDPDHPGEISHFQALSSALSATVGLGNIAGVAIAITKGGPGAVFWLWVAGFLGMSSKFTEVTLGQMYRRIDDNGVVAGGPMYYLRDGLAEVGLGPLGKVLAVLFSLMCIGGSFGGGNMFQVSQSYASVANVVPLLHDYPVVYGILLAGLVALVILGGIKRIGFAAGMIVPFMVLVYVLAAVAVLVTNAAHIPAAFGAIFREAFTPDAAYGGMLGVLVVGFQRASFSNEAGVGSASIAHAAASTDEPVREGVVGLLEPFIDTIVVCTMTALVVVVTGVYTESGADGVVLTSEAFATVFPWFPIVLTMAVLLFAFSTMISWSYYGDRATQFLFGSKAVVPYRVLFCVFVVLGSILDLENVLGFSDLMVLGMAFPNILGAVILSRKVKGALDTYLGKLHSGAFDR